MRDSRIKFFLEAYPADFGWEQDKLPWRDENTIALMRERPPLFTAFLSQFAAPSHGKGVIKFLSNVSTPTIFQFNSNGACDWPQWRDRLVVFAYDWNASLFGFDKARKKGGEMLISILEPDSGELLETPHSFADFLMHSATDEADPAFSLSFYSEWLKQGGAVPPPGMCVGVKVPLFLAGSDTLDNLTMQPLEIYVSLCGQMYQESRRHPPGTRFSGTKIT